jgi:hypothetical protein
MICLVFKEQFDLLERVMRIELTTSAWKAEVLPLNYTRILLFYKMVGKTGFEPATPWSQTKCSTKLSYSPLFKMARPKGVEPITF